MKKLIVFIFFLSVCGLSSCSKNLSTGTNQTVQSQTGSNKAFPSNKHARVKSKRFRASKSSMKSKQREHARYSGNEAVTQ